MERNNLNFVLVHGGWHGAWVWERLVPYLAQAGYNVFTPDLTGLGAKVKLANPDIGLSTHIQDVLAILDDKNLHNVLLVGHSYGGMVITGVADKAVERIAKLIYLDAHVPKDGQSFGDIVGPQIMDIMRQVAKATGQGWLVPTPPPEHFGITLEADIAFVKSKLVPQPIKTFEEPVHLITNPATFTVPRTYIYLNKPPLGSFDGFAKMARSSKDWSYYEMATGHDAMILEPQKLAELFIKIANE
jgi:pimeloyl-ACP methyl ester carboxylesterase